MDINDVTLLPCPFCGGIASVMECYDTIKYTDGGHFVTCLKCDLRLGSYRNKFEAESGEYKTEAEAIAAWNARANDNMAVLQLAELMRGLEIPPSAIANSPQFFHGLGCAIAYQAKQWKGHSDSGVVSTLESEIEEAQ